MTTKEEKLKEQIKVLKKELKRYQKGYNILSCYFDSISDEEQITVNKQLTRLGL